MAAALVVVDRATILEWPQIEALARAYFERMGREYQDRRETATWYVARCGERVDGCFSIQVHEAYGQLWILDLYRSEGFSGARATRAMWKYAYALAEEIGYATGFMVDPANAEWLQYVDRYSDATLVGLLYLRPPP